MCRPQAENIKREISGRECNYFYFKVKKIFNLMVSNQLKGIYYAVLYTVSLIPKHFTFSTILATNLQIINDCARTDPGLSTAGADPGRRYTLCYCG